MKKRRTLFMFLAIGACTAAICIGIFLGENKIVLNKAVVVCLECIGIG